MSLGTFFLCLLAIWFLTRSLITVPKHMSITPLFPVCFFLFSKWWTIKSGTTPLHMAALHGHLKVVDYFVQKCNMDPNLLHKVLRWAYRVGDLGVCLLWFEICICTRRWVIYAVYVYPTTHLTWNQSLTLIATLHVMCVCEHTFLPPSCLTSFSLCVHVCFLFSNRWTVKHKGAPIHAAAVKGHLNVVDYLITKCKADPHQSNEVLSRVWPHRLLVCVSVYIRIPRLRNKTYHHLSYGFLFSKWWTIQNGLTPLHLAAWRGHLNVVEYLVLKCNVDLNQPTKVVLGRMWSKLSPLTLWLPSLCVCVCFCLLNHGPCSAELLHFGSPHKTATSIL